MTEVIGFSPQWGFGPRFVRRHGRAARTATGPWRGTVTSTAGRDGLAHTALIPGGLERGRFAGGESASEGRRHRPRVSARCRDGLSGARLRVPLHPDTFGRDAVRPTNKPTDKSMSVANEWRGQAHPRHHGRRHLRPPQGRQGRPRRDVGGTVTRPAGNPAGQRIAPSGMELTRFLPRLKSWVSALRFV